MGEFGSCYFLKAEFMTDGSFGLWYICQYTTCIQACIMHMPRNMEWYSYLYLLHVKHFHLSMEDGMYKATDAVLSIC